MRYSSFLNINLAFDLLLKNKKDNREAIFSANIFRKKVGYTVSADPYFIRYSPMQCTYFSNT